MLLVTCSVRAGEVEAQNRHHNPITECMYQGKGLGCGHVVVNSCVCVYIYMCVMLCTHPVSLILLPCSQSEKSSGDHTGNQNELLSGSKMLTDSLTLFTLSLSFQSFRLGLWLNAHWEDSYSLEWVHWYNIYLKNMYNKRSASNSKSKLLFPFRTIDNATRCGLTESQELLINRTLSYQKLLSLSVWNTTRIPSNPQRNPAFTTINNIE